MAKRRVISYIDGFNFYFALQDQNWARYKWLDFTRLSEALLKTDQTLVATKYFTARVTSLEKARRQTTFLEALDTRPDISIHYGYFRDEQKFCKRCQQRTYIPTEKMTDVNIAVEMLNDAYKDAFDTALLMGGDTDLVPSIRVIRNEFPDKRIVVAFPPDRVNDDLRLAAHSNFVIGRAKIAHSQLPDSVSRSDGYLLQRPDSWK